MVVYRTYIGTGPLNIGFVYATNWGVKNTNAALFREAKRVASKLELLRTIVPLGEILSYIDILPIAYDQPYYKERFRELSEKTRNPKNYVVSCSKTDYLEQNQEAPNMAFPDESRFVVDGDDPITFAHELGHVFGLAHPDNDCHQKCYAAYQIFPGLYIGGKKPYTDNCPHVGDVMGWCSPRLSRKRIIRVIQNPSNSIVPRFNETDREFLRSYAK